MTLATKPRWDKFDGYVGNPRGMLAADIDLATEANKVLATGLNSVGAIVIGAGVTGVLGLMIVPVGIDMNGNLLSGGINTQAGDPNDIGKHGEITSFSPWDATADADADPLTPTASTRYYGHPDGSVLAATGPGAVYVGHTVEADRLIVDVDSPFAAVLDSAPIGVSAVGGTGQVTLTWVPVKGATGYKIQKSADGTTWAAGVPATSVNPTVVETGLSAGTEYFHVLATVGGVDSAYSATVKATVS
jgi:hypothetical protein